MELPEDASNANQSVRNYSDVSYDGDVSSHSRYDDGFKDNASHFEEDIISHFDEDDASSCGDWSIHSIELRSII